MNRILLLLINDYAEIIPLPDDLIDEMRGIIKVGKPLAKELMSESKKDNKFDRISQSKKSQYPNQFIGTVDSISAGVTN